MKKLIALWLICNLACVLPLNCSAIAVSATSAVVIDAFSGRVIYEKNANQKMSMASTTKIMTAICAIENGDLEKEVTVDPSAVGVEGSSIYLQKDEVLSLRHLLYGLMLNSGNDAAVAIACAVGGNVENFSHMMNQTASKIGVKNSHFQNPNGLDQDGHYTTAYDLAKISAYAMKNEDFRKIVSTPKTTIPYAWHNYPRHLSNHNKLLRMYDGCIGIKTGFTKKSGRCLVSAAQRGNSMLIAVTLKAPDDWNDHTNMLNYGFEQVKSKNIITADGYACTVAVKGGTKNTAMLVFDSDYYVTEIAGKPNDVKIKYKTSKSLTAPVGYRQKAGYAEVFFNGSKIGSVDLVTQNVVSKDNTKTLKRSAFLILQEFFEYEICSMIF